jgi:hypothetical protein
MAQTKKRRRRKHRGTQAGTVGKRRSRPRSRAEAKAQARSRASSRKKGSSRSQRVADRVGSPPTWRGALNRALIASGIFLLLLVLLFGRPFTEAFALSAFMLLVYIPMGYYFDRFFYRWRLRREENQRLERKAEKENAKA